MRHAIYTIAAVTLALAPSGCLAVDDEPLEVDTISSESHLTEHYAYRIPENGYVQTDLDFSEFFGADHTIAAWVMPEFVYNDAGPIFANSNGGGTFIVGQGDYRTGNGDNGHAGDPVLYVSAGNKKAIYLAPSYKPRTWNHIAVVREASWFGYTFRLYLNGAKLTPVQVTKTKDDDGNVVSVDVESSSDVKYGYGWDAIQKVPQGTLRLGRWRSGLNYRRSRVWQYYGLIDDVAVYDRALSWWEIFQLAGSMVDMFMDDLVAGWTFDDSPYRRDPRLSRPVTAHGPAERWSMPATRTDASAARFDNWFDVSPTVGLRELPLEPGTVAKVTQGVASRGGSHNGRDAFCWDFQVKQGSQRVHAASDSTLVRVSESGKVIEEREPYTIKADVAPGEFDEYLHLAEGSFTDVYLDGDEPVGDFLSLPHPDYPFTWIEVERGEPLAEIGPHADHLHFCGRDGLGGAWKTAPIGFQDYYVSKDGGLTWTWVVRGMPENDDYVYQDS